MACSGDVVKGELSLLELHAETEIKEKMSVISESISLLEGDSGRGKDLSSTELGTAFC
jgi:hypothetical protein